MRMSKRSSKVVTVFKGFEKGWRLSIGLFAMFFIAFFIVPSISMGQQQVEEVTGKAVPEAQEQTAAERADDKMIPELLDINVQGICPDIGGLPKDRKVVKGFTHKAHAEQYLKGNSAYSANSYEDGFTCVACHPGFETRDAIADADRCKRLAEAIPLVDGKRDVKKVFHAQCLDCHKAMKKDGKTTGPVSCKGCHSKK